MKKGETFQLNYQWWNKGRPTMLKSTGLGKALQEYEKVQKNTAKPIVPLRALAAVDAARLNALRLCGQNYADTRAALQAVAAITKAKNSLWNIIDTQLAGVYKELAVYQPRLTTCQKIQDDLDSGKLSDAEQKKKASSLNVLLSGVDGIKLKIGDTVTNLIQQKTGIERLDKARAAKITKLGEDYRAFQSSAQQLILASKDYQGI